MTPQQSDGGLAAIQAAMARTSTPEYRSSIEAGMAEMRAHRARVEAFQKKKADEAAAARAAYWRSWLPGKKTGGKLKRKRSRRSYKRSNRRSRRSNRSHRK